MWQNFSFFYRLRLLSSIAVNLLFVCCTCITFVAVEPSPRDTGLMAEIVVRDRDSRCTGYCGELWPMSTSLFLKENPYM